MYSTASEYLKKHKQSKDPLGKPSILSRHKPLEHLDVMIIDPDLQLALLMKNILFGLGCQSITIERDGKAALEKLHETPVDLLIMESDLGDMGGLELAQELRRETEGGGRYLPIVMVTWHNDLRHVEQARDYGVDEYLLKPFAARSLLERIYQLIERPRPFVLSPFYVGPDRRRRPQNDNQPACRADGTTFVVRRPLALTPRGSAPPQAQFPCLVEPDYSLQKKIGFAVTHYTQLSIPISPPDGRALLQHEAGELAQAFAMLQSQPEKPSLFAGHIRLTAHSLAGHARAEGYGRVAEIASLLHDFCRYRFSAGAPAQIKVLGSYIDAIAMLLQHDVRGDGGKLGAALYSNLCDLGQFYG